MVTKIFLSMAECQGLKEHPSFIPVFLHQERVQPSGYLRVSSGISHIFSPSTLCKGHDNDVD